MVLVCAWSVWAWAEPRSNEMAGHHHHGAPPAVVQAAEGAPPSGAESAEEEEHGPAPFNFFQFGSETPPFIAMLVNFGILAAGYYLLGRKPIAAALQHRRDAVAKEIEEAQRMREQAEARAKTYQAKLERLEEEMRVARDALVRAGEAERDRIVAEAEANAERMRRDATFLVEQEIKQIRQDLWRETLESAVAAAEELLRRGVTPADQERLAEDYLADLGGRPRPSTPNVGARPSGAENAS
jgi:F-type H+-transporting ATPase subunit b